MYFLYNIAVEIAAFFLPLAALFSDKLSLFVKGRKKSLDLLEKRLEEGDRSIWFHCASLGEFEQGRPIIEASRELFPGHKIILTFFSPSGYETQKDYAHADLVMYLPIDTRRKVKKFVRLVKADMAVFVKYEFWPNLLRELEIHSIPTILVSGIFRENQIFFRNSGSWMRRSLNAFDHFFVQNKKSESLLRGIGFNNVTQCGDTRFDRVNDILSQDNRLDFLEDFVKNSTILIAGSTWPKDESILLDFINEGSGSGQKFIIAPHQMDHERIKKLKDALNKKCSLYSEGTPDEDIRVFILDTVGLLTKVYSYADIAYVGGGFDKEGVHNVLEPAVFGVPLVIGPIFDKFQEAVDLVQRKGCIAAENAERCQQSFADLFEQESLRTRMGEINRNYIQEHTGATKTISNYLEEKI